MLNIVKSCNLSQLKLNISTQKKTSGRGDGPWKGFMGMDIHAHGEYAWACTYGHGSM